MSEPARRWAWGAGAAAAMLVPMLAGLLGGCTPQGWVVLMRPDPEQKYQYKLAKAPLLVLVDEPVNAARDPLTRYHLVSQLSEQLRKHKVNRQVIPEDDVQRILKTRPTAAQWTEAELGKALHAQQVLHVQIEPLNRDDSDAFGMGGYGVAKLSARVRVIDVDTGDQLWPIETAGQEVMFEVPGREMRPADEGTRLRAALAVGLADRIAKLFYTHRISEKEATRQRMGEGTP